MGGGAASRPSSPPPDLSPARWAPARPPSLLGSRPASPPPPRSCPFPSLPLPPSSAAPSASPLQFLLACPPPGVWSLRPSPGQSHLLPPPPTILPVPLRLSPHPHPLAPSSSAVPQTSRWVVPHQVRAPDPRLPPPPVDSGPACLSPLGFPPTSHPGPRPALFSTLLCFIPTPPRPLPFPPPPRPHFWTLRPLRPPVSISAVSLGPALPAPGPLPPLRWLTCPLPPAQLCRAQRRWGRGVGRQETWGPGPPCPTSPLCPTVRPFPVIAVCSPPLSLTALLLRERGVQRNGPSFNSARQVHPPVGG